MMLPTLSLAIVEWNDTTHKSGWHNRVETESAIADGVMTIKSAGWLVSDTEKHVVLAMSSSELSLGDLLLIPRSAIVNVHINKAPGQDDDD